MSTLEYYKSQIRMTLITLLLSVTTLTACQVSLTSVPPTKAVTPPIPESTSTPQRSMETKPDDGPKIVLDDPGIPFNQAQSATNFHLLSPTYFPETFEFLGVSVMNKYEVALNYLKSDPSQRLAVLVQTLVGANSQFNVVMETQNAQIVTTNGTEAIWIYDPNGDEGLLDWTLDDIRYRLVGITDLQEALKIAESLE